MGRRQDPPEENTRACLRKRLHPGRYRQEGGQPCGKGGAVCKGLLRRSGFSPSFNDGALGEGSGSSHHGERMLFEMRGQSFEQPGRSGENHPY